MESWEEKWYALGRDDEQGSTSKAVDETYGEAQPTDLISGPGQSWRKLI